MCLQASADRLYLDLACIFLDQQGVPGRLVLEMGRSMVISIVPSWTSTSVVSLCLVVVLHTNKTVGYAGVLYML